jgi:hypothetical protein
VDRRPSQSSSVLGEEKQLQSIASMLFFTPLWSACILPSLLPSLSTNSRKQAMEDTKAVLASSWSLELVSVVTGVVSKLQAKAECANQQHSRSPLYSACADSMAIGHNSQA